MVPLRTTHGNDLTLALENDLNNPGALLSIGNLLHTTVSSRIWMMIRCPKKLLEIYLANITVRGKLHERGKCLVDILTLTRTTSRCLRLLRQRLGGRIRPRSTKGNDILSLERTTTRCLRLLRQRLGGSIPSRSTKRNDPSDLNSHAIPILSKISKVIHSSAINPVHR
jgi:hypothetical protein